MKLDGHHQNIRFNSFETTGNSYDLVNVASFMAFRRFVLHSRIQGCIQILTGQMHMFVVLLCLVKKKQSLGAVLNTMEHYKCAQQFLPGEYC